MNARFASLRWTFSVAGLFCLICSASGCVPLPLPPGSAPGTPDLSNLTIRYSTYPSLGFSQSGSEWVKWQTEWVVNAAGEVAYTGLKTTRSEDGAQLVSVESGTAQVDPAQVRRLYDAFVEAKFWSAKLSVCLPTDVEFESICITAPPAHANKCVSYRPGCPRAEEAVRRAMEPVDRLREQIHTLVLDQVQWEGIPPPSIK